LPESAPPPGFPERWMVIPFRCCGIVGANLGADAVFEWSNDFSARGVILGVGGEDEEDVKREAEGISP